MSRLMAALRRFDDSPEGDALGVAFLFACLWAGLCLTGVR